MGVITGGEWAAENNREMPSLRTTMALQTDAAWLNCDNSKLHLNDTAVVVFLGLVTLAGQVVFTNHTVTVDSKGGQSLWTFRSIGQYHPRCWNIEAQQIPRLFGDKCLIFTEQRPAVREAIALADKLSALIRNME